MAFVTLHVFDFDDGQFCCRSWFYAMKRAMSKRKQDGMHYAGKPGSFDATRCSMNGRKTAHAAYCVYCEDHDVVIVLQFAGCVIADAAGSSL